MGALLFDTAAGDFSNRDEPWRGEPIYKLHAEVHKRAGMWMVRVRLHDSTGRAGWYSIRLVE